MLDFGKQELVSFLSIKFWCNYVPSLRLFAPRLHYIDSKDKRIFPAFCAYF